MTGFAEIFANAHERTPDSIALVHGQTKMSYAELDAAARAFAVRLRRLDVGAEKVVAILLPRSVELIVAILGVLKTGAAYLPIDPANPPDRIAYMLADAAAVAVVTGNDLTIRLPEHCRRVQVDPAAAAEVAAELASPCADHSAAYIIYTSGSTGQPKGVVVTHTGLPALAEAQRVAYEVTPDSRVLQLASPSFDAMVIELLMTWQAGATLVIPTADLMFGEALAAAIEQDEITHALITPAALGSLPAEARLPSLQTLIVGGEACPGSLVARFSPHHRMINAYGPTEATACVTLSAPLSGSSPPPIGRPIAGTRVLVLDGMLQPVPVGVPGELYIVGPCLARGYLGRPALTAQHFIACPFGPPGGRMYRTGDVVRWRSDRTLEYIARADSQVKLRGFRIELPEVEAALRDLPGVAQAAASVREDRPGDRRLAAYLVAAPGAEPPDFTLYRQLLARFLPEPMIPSLFVMLPALPLTTTGKLDRRALPKPPDSAAVQGRDPATPTERALCDLFASTLDVARVDVDANFFEMGGHSLLAIRLGRRIRETLSPLFPIAGVYAAPSVAQIAAILDESAAPAASGFDLAADLRLPQDIVQQAASRTAPPRGLRQVFLTGATGFVGVHLLACLLRQTEARVICHVRAGDSAQAWARLRAAWQARLSGQALDEARVSILCGDIAAPALGLGPAEAARVQGEVDAILHCAASVDFLHPYASLKAANIDSLVTLLRWTATGAPKRLHHISTLGVIDMTQGSGPVDEDDPLPHWRGLVGGYAQSKYVADWLARRALRVGLPVSIHRLGSVAGDRAHGICNEADFIWRLARFSASLGALPRLDLALNLTPVDDVARAIVRLADAEARLGAVHHLLAERTPALSDIADAFATLGVAAEMLAPDAWAERALLRAAASDDAELGAILAICSQHGGVPGGRVIAADATASRLRQLDATIEPVAAPLLVRYLKSVGIGAAPAPASLLAAAE